MISLRKKILLTLYLPTLEKQSEGAIEGFSYELLYSLFPMFSAVSVRTLVAQLVNEKIVSTYLIEGRTRVSLSQTGRDLVRRSFPALFPKRGGIDEMWSVCIFGQALNIDPHFRKTRELLLSYGFFPFTKGVYVIPLKFPESLVTTLKEEKLLSALLISQHKKFLFGSEEELIRLSYKTDQIITAKQRIDAGIEKLQKSVTSPLSRFPQTSATYQKILGELILAGEQPFSIPEKYLMKEMRIYDSLEKFKAISLRYFMKILTQ